jgi:PIN domain nuclease of toxin-antitoxin system
MVGEARVVKTDIAASNGSLPSVHGDPFDLMIAGQALVDRMTVMTSDPVFRRYKGVRVFDT